MKILFHEQRTKINGIIFRNEQAVFGHAFYDILLFSDKAALFINCIYSLLQDLFSINAYVYAQKPQLDIHSFEGNFTRVRKCSLIFHTHTICPRDNIALTAEQGKLGTVQQCELHLYDLPPQKLIFYSVIKCTAVPFAVT